MFKAFYGFTFNPFNKEIATKYGGERTINSIIKQLEEFIELRRNE